MIIISLFLASFVIFRGVLKLDISRNWKIVLSLLTAVVAFKFYILRIFGGKMFFAPELPGWILLPFAWLFALLMFWSCWLIFCDIKGAAVSLYRRCRKNNKTEKNNDSRLRLIGLIPAVLLVSIGMYEGLKVPEVRICEIVLPNLPEELSGLKILQLSDIHADPITGREKVQQVVDAGNRLQADLVVLTGDYVDGRMAVRGRDLEVLRQLDAPLGVFGVPGNHEYYSGYSEWMDFLRGCGIRMLENQHVILMDGKLALGGVTDPAALRMRMPLPDIEKTFSGVAPETFKILLAHQPKLAEDASENGVDLQLSGHTHGGMVWGLDLLVGYFNRGRVSGEYTIGDMKLYISNGTGIWNGFPIRLGRRSEITLLILKKE